MRPRAWRPQLKRDPLGSRPGYVVEYTSTRASALLLSLALLTCERGQRVANMPKDCAQSRAPEPASLSALDSFSTGGPIDDIPSLLAGFDWEADVVRRQACAVAGTPRADSLFLSFRSRFVKMGEEVTGRLDQATGIQSDVLEDTVTSRQLTTLLAKHGFALEYSEGNAYADEDMGYWARLFDGALTPAMQKYVGLRATEQAMRFSEDAVLQISWDELAGRAVTWEQFADSYPDFSWQEASRFWYNTYLSAYLTGMANSRVFSDSGTLEPGVRASYEHLVARYPLTRTAQLVAQYLTLLKQNGYRQSAAIDSLLREHHVASMLGVQPPIR